MNCTEKSLIWVAAGAAAAFALYNVSGCPWGCTSGCHGKKKCGKRSQKTGGCCKEDQVPQSGSAPAVTVAAPSEAVAQTQLAESKRNSERRPSSAAVVPAVPVKKDVPGSALLGGVEAGGTTFKLTIARGSPTNIIERIEVHTTTPEETLKVAVDFLRKYDVAAVGLAAFGPIDIDRRSPTYGYVTATPKEGWRNVDVLGPFRALDVPVGFTTDVQAAALGELQHGNHGDIASCCYITVGTGVGVGVVSHGKAVGGLTHPEGGHVRLKRHPSDHYAGNCPYHTDCAEALCNAQAIAARAGIPASDLHTLPDDHKVWELEAFYLAQLCSHLVLIVSPEVIILGGGVLKRRSLFPKIRIRLVEQLNGYVPIKRIVEETDRYIVPSVHDAGHDSNAGSVGALELARLAYLGLPY